MDRKWIVTFYSKEVKRIVKKLPIGLLTRYARLATLMEIYGPNLGMPHTKHLGKGLIELRLKSIEGIARIFFTVVLEEIIILHSIIKKTEQIPPQDLNLAYKRLLELRK